MIKMQRKYTVLFMPSGRRIEVKEGTTILDAARMADIEISAPCGGTGRCRKCTVIISSEEFLACQTPVHEDITVYIPEEATLRVLEETVDSDTPLECVEKFGIAVDIGTTTVVASLVDLSSGKTIRTEASENRQRIFGEDVLSRMLYADSEKRRKKMQSLIVNTVNGLIKKLQEKIKIDDIEKCVFSGNTVMIHFLLGEDTKYLRLNPDTHIFNLKNEIKAKDLGLILDGETDIFCIPGIASYVGGDIVADILVSELHKEEGISILVDVGTNGEIAIGSKEFIAACSCSAGPAFEGGEVECGMRAVEGAIEKLKIKDGRFFFETIGNKDPRGLCGSGLIDLIACIFREGIIDKSGNIRSGEERISITDDIWIREREIKSIIRTKAAIYAGMKALISEMGLGIEDIERIYIAGGFGHFINMENAITIGLFPDLPHKKFFFLGNGSLAGAKAVLISDSKKKESYKIAESATHIDLSKSKVFQEEYMASLFLPHTDLNNFPTVKG